MVSDSNEWNDADAWTTFSNGIEERDPVQRDKIFATNIPKELNIDGLKNLFGKYGTIKDISKPTDKSFVFITYTSIA